MAAAYALAAVVNDLSYTVAICKHMIEIVGTMDRPDPTTLAALRLLLGIALHSDAHQIRAGRHELLALTDSNGHLLDQEIATIVRRMVRWSWWYEIKLKLRSLITWSDWRKEEARAGQIYRNVNTAERPQLRLSWIYGDIAIEHDIDFRLNAEEHFGRVAELELAVGIPACAVSLSVWLYAINLPYDYIPFLWAFAAITFVLFLNIKIAKSSVAMDEAEASLLPVGLWTGAGTISYAEIVGVRARWAGLARRVRITCRDGTTALMRAPRGYFWRPRARRFHEQLDLIRSEVLERGGAVDGSIPPAVGRMAGSAALTALAIIPLYVAGTTRDFIAPTAPVISTLPTACSVVDDAVSFPELPLGRTEFPFAQYRTQYSSECLAEDRGNATTRFSRVEVALYRYTWSPPILSAPATAAVQFSLGPARRGRYQAPAHRGRRIFLHGTAGWSDPSRGA